MVSLMISILQCLHIIKHDKMNIRQDLEENGYKSYEASISAFGSNYDRAVELYYYIKGGRVDYGAAHAAKYGHKRYGKTYEGVYKDWKPGQKVHLVGHSMGGQTIRQLEELLRNGNPEEVKYQKNMVAKFLHYIKVIMTIWFLQSQL